MEADGIAQLRIPGECTKRVADDFPRLSMCTDRPISSGKPSRLTRRSPSQLVLGVVIVVSSHQERSRPPHGLKFAHSSCVLQACNPAYKHKRYPYCQTTSTHELVLTFSYLFLAYRRRPWAIFLVLFLQSGRLHVLYSMLLLPRLLFVSPIPIRKCVSIQVHYCSYHHSSLQQGTARISRR